MLGVMEAAGGCNTAALTWVGWGRSGHRDREHGSADYCRVVPFSSFSSPHFFDAFWYADFKYPISFFLTRQKCDAAGHLKVNFGWFLAVFIILCGIQLSGWSSHLIREKCCLFASFWCINDLVIPITLRSTTLCIRFPPTWLMVERAAAICTQKYLKVLLYYWSKDSKLPWTRVWSCHPEPSHLGDFPRQDMPTYQHNNETTCPHSYSTLSRNI